MRKYYFNLVWTSVIIIGITSCSHEETKTQNDIVSRPTVPVMASEVQIGNQIWMTKNLNISYYSDGTPIPHVQDPTQWANLTTGAWCYYNNDPANGAVYGKLYNWYAVVGIHDNNPNTPNKKLAPEGWHIPTNAEWTTLTSFLSGPDVAGGKMKAIILWTNPNTGANNSSGFNAFPGGARGNVGEFSGIRDYGGWWSSTNFNSTQAFYRFLSYNSANIVITGNNKEWAFSVRCIKN